MTWESERDKPDLTYRRRLARPEKDQDVELSRFVVLLLSPGALYLRGLAALGIWIPTNEAGTAPETKIRLDSGLWTLENITPARTDVLPTRRPTLPSPYISDC